MGDTVFVGRACGKAILLGEHFVVHGRPALAIPLRRLQTMVSMQLRSDSAGLIVETQPDVVSPAMNAVRLLAERFGVMPERLSIRIDSCVPLGCGLGSSAAFAVAVVRAFQHLVAFPSGGEPDVEVTNSMAFVLECLAHGNPSGVDNTVVSFERPLVFRRDQPPRLIGDNSSLTFLVADSGIRHSTALAVAAVGEFAKMDPIVFHDILCKVESIVESGVDAYLRSDGPSLGNAMFTNHNLLRQVGVSSAPLDRLVCAALDAGAWGAKLTGAGVGGSVLAVTSAEAVAKVTKSLRNSGARQVLVAQ
ncbi:MAG: mevalonate kinase, partial [Myxococcales bacterium]|nr:mevalonate kinase [Myxococcales bacterium]